MIGLPYGELRVKYSDGAESTVPNTLRLLRNEVTFVRHETHKQFIFPGNHPLLHKVHGGDREGSRDAQQIVDDSHSGDLCSH